MRGRLIVLALIAVVARGLIPAGFMPGSVDGHPQLVICNGHMAGMAQSDHHAHSGASADVLCPFAHCAAAAPLASLPGILPIYEAIAAPVASIERTLPAEIPRRYAAPRGPPPLV